MGHVTRVGKLRNLYTIFVEKPEGKRPLGRPRHRWEDNIRIHLREIELEVVDCIHVAHDRDQWRALVNTAMKPSVSIKGGECLD